MPLLHNSAVKTAHGFLKTLLYLISSALYRVQHIRRGEDVEVSILMYHSVDEKTDWKYGVHPDEFLKQMEYLSDHFSIVSLEDVVGYVKGEKKLKNKSVALTFDDGYKDTYEIVFPILKRYNFPATVFLTTDLPRKPELGNLPRPDWGEIQRMAVSEFVRFEVHGHEHKNLKLLCEKNRKLLQEELETCRKKIKDYTGYEPKYVSYAFGHKDKCVIEEVKKLGYEAGFSINEGIVRKGDDVYQLKRTQVDRTMNFLQFKIRLSGALDIHRKIVSAFRGSYARWR